MFIYLHPHGRISADSLAALLRTLNARFQGQPLTGMIVYISTKTQIKKVTS